MRVLMIMMFLVTVLSVSVAADLSADVAVLSTETIGAELPGAVGSLFGNEKINIYIQQESGAEFVVGLITQDKKISSLAEGAVAEPTLNVYTSEKAILEIQQAQDPGKELLRAFKDERITYKAVGFGNKVKFAFTSLFAKVMGLFSSGNEDKNQDKAQEKAEDKREKAEDKQDKAEEKQEETEEGKEEEKEEEKEVTEGKTSGKTDLKEDSELVTKEPQNTTLEVVPKTHIILLEPNGFNPYALTIKVGDSVTWKVSRTGTISSGMILGTQNCIDIKSQILKNGETYTWTSTEAETCTIVDGIVTTQTSTIVIE